MAEHDDAAAGELTDGGGVAVLDPEIDDIDETDADDAGDTDGADERVDEPAKPKRVRRLAAVLGLVLVVALSTLVGWLVVRTHRATDVDERQSQIVQAARQGALNLTTIDWQRADADVQRILDSATGEFYDDFAKRSAPFINVVKEAKSTSTGSITEAGLESESGDSAQVLVAVAVKTSNVGAPEQQPREWRMRLAVQKVGDVMKVSNVEFVP
ncbi:Mce associated membrane protein [Mycolicibacterium sp. TY66]|uniref:mammalian cell entry protein n=1 Tax=unclassified Mycolicibacterium TaxID=2636767 RepID=UPI001BB3CD6E|nr:MULTISPECIES: mammalian cell entry protein [unclassified Mycolicibacterium]BCI82594.1 Mce associated membrane protein [Mycolicibacterium sp. TY66]BCJ79759.1 Mce associated membrane protein [Mycolicibacterium sp. TY81]